MNNDNLNRPWHECTFVAFDTETTGAFPVGSEIVEFGAVKCQGGKVIDSMEELFRPKKLMSEEIIKIHGITNEMVVDKPEIEKKIFEINQFLKDAVLLAHHAPFDMGFLAYEFEKAHVPFPQTPVLCTSLLSRKLIHGSVNHKLQTLISFLGIPQGAAHRAHDDAEACLHVGLECFQRVGKGGTLADLYKIQGKTLLWDHYSLLTSRNPVIDKIVQAAQKGTDLEMIYSGGTHKGKVRKVTPLGIVRNPDGDYLPAICHLDQSSKRFYLNKIEDVG